MKNLADKIKSTQKKSKEVVRQTPKLSSKTISIVQKPKKKEIKAIDVRLTKENKVRLDTIKFLFRKNGLGEKSLLEMINESIEVACEKIDFKDDTIKNILKKDDNLDTKLIARIPLDLVEKIELLKYNIKVEQDYFVSINTLITYGLKIVLNKYEDKLDI